MVEARIHLKVLVHIPSRGRPQQLADCSARWRDAVHDHRSTLILCSVDEDDPTCAHLDAQDPTATGEMILRGNSSCKVAAINRDIDKVIWDILVVASDDLSPMMQGFDERIREDFASEAPDLDAVLWYGDPKKGRICMHPVIGRTYYQRDGYVYHNSYRGFYCDDEMSAVAQQRKKLFFSTNVIFQHNHPNHKTRKSDATDARNKQWMMLDYRNFAKRMGQGFPR